MLDVLSIRCPHCHEPTEISVSRGGAGGTGFSTTACRRCRAPFVAMTQEDGRVLLFDATTPGQDPGGTPKLLGIIEPPAGASGYRVEAPDYLGIFDVGFPPPEPKPGLSDEELDERSVMLDRVLRKPDGSLRPPAELARRIGWRGVWTAQLSEAIEARLCAPPSLSFPPSIFVSYRWGSQAENEWVAGVARTLKARGYPVVFDRDEPGEIDVPDLVSKVADARWFLAILDDGYAERIGRGEESDRIKDGWVFDEFNTAAGFSNARRLRIVGLLRGGTMLPRGFRHPSPGTQGNVVDARDPARLALVLDEVFPEIANAPDERTVQRARASLAASHAHLCDGEFESAYAAAEELTGTLPGVVDGPAQKVRVALRAGWGDVGLAAAEEAMRIAPRSRELLRAAAIFAAPAGQPQRAVEYAARFLEEATREERAVQAQLHHVLGSALDDLGQVYPAIAQLECARRLVPDDPGVLNTLGFVYRRAGEAAAAIERLEKGLRIDGGSPSLLLNLAAAQLEEGRTADAADALARLEAAVPGHPSVAGLAAEIARAGSPTGTGTRPRLVATVSTKTMERWVACTSCAARVPLGARESLCARCGGVAAMQPGPCPHCTATGRVVLIPGLAQQCPYCRSGALAVADRPAPLSPQ